MTRPTLGLLETSATRILGNTSPNATLMRVARCLSARARVLVACWHQLDLGREHPRLHTPLLELEEGESRVWCPRNAVDVDALWFFPVAGRRLTPLTTEETVAETRFAAAGVRCAGNSADTTARVLYAQACRAVPTNAAGPLGRIGRKDQLEHGLRWFERVAGIAIPRPETHVTTGARLAETLAVFRGRDCIVKPANSGGGRGIHVIAAGCGPEQTLSPAATFVVQDLVRDPLVLKGSKADLRCYLLVTTRGGRTRSRRVGPIFVRTAPAPYERLVPQAEITNTSFRRRLGLGPSIQPLDAAFAPLLGDALRAQVDQTCEALLDFVFAWRAEYARREPSSSQVMLWGIDLLVSGPPSARKLQLLEINIYPQLHRNDRLCDELVDRMLLEEYFPEILASTERVESPTAIQAGAG